jgi:YD repeat-containing protein
VLAVSLVGNAILSAAPAAAVTNPGWRGMSYPERPTAMAPAFGGAAVNTLTGNLVIRRVLLAVPGKGVPLELYLTWNADRRLVSSPYGMGWNLSCNMRFVEDAAGNVAVVWGDGRVDAFSGAGAGFTSPPGVFMSLEESAPDTYSLRSTHGLVFAFASGVHRRLTSITDPNGNTLDFAYAANRLSTATDAGGRRWTFEYDSVGRLMKVDDPNLQRSWSLEYDAASRLVRLTDPAGNAEQYAYDGDNLIVSITDRRGNTASITYLSPPASPATRLAVSVSKAGRTIGFAYDAAARTTTLTDPNGNPWLYSYDVDQRLAAITDPLLAQAAFAWDEAENLTAFTDRRGTTSTFAYDDQGNLLSSTVPLSAGASAVSVWTYEPGCGRVSGFTDPRGSTWSFDHDAACNLTQITDPAALGTSASFAYDDAGQPTTFTDRSGRATTFTYDAAGNLASHTDGASNTWEYEYDGGSRLTRVGDPLGHDFGRAYDALDRLVATRDALGRSDEFAHDEAGHLVSYEDREGNLTQYAYDALGRLVALTDAFGRSDDRAYDANGNLTAYTDRRGFAWLATFDAANRVVSRTNPLGNTWQYAYDANANLIGHTDALGRLNSNTFDLANRIIQRDFVGSRRITFEWDTGSNMLGSRDEVVGSATLYGDHDWTYDAAGRRLTYADNILARSVGYQWDGDGRQLGKTLPSGQQTTYAYDAAGQPATLSAFGGTGAFSYDAAGNLIGETRANGVTSTFTYDANNRLASTTIEAPALPVSGSHLGSLATDSVLASWAYTRDANGRIAATLRESGEHIAYTLDPLGRVIQEAGNLATLGGAYSLIFGYDEAGNRVQSDLTSPTTTQTRDLTFDLAGLASSMTTVTNGTSTVINYARNANGAITQAQRVDPPGFVPYYHDARNRLYQIGATGSNPRTFSLDQFGRLTYTQQGSDTLRIMYGSDEPVWMYGSRAPAGGALAVRQNGAFNYECSQRPEGADADNVSSGCPEHGPHCGEGPSPPRYTRKFSGSPCPEHGYACPGDPEIDPTPDRLDLPHACDDGSDTYEFQLGANRDGDGTGTGFCGGGECSELDSGMLTEEGGAIAGWQDDHCDWVDRGDSAAPPGLEAILGATGEGCFGFGSLEICDDGAFDALLDEATAPGGEGGRCRWEQAREALGFEPEAPGVERPRGGVPLSSQRDVNSGLKLDGTEGKSAFFGYGRGGEGDENEGLVVVQDSVTGFEVITNGWSPEVGQGGGYVGVVTRRGSNDAKHIAPLLFGRD